MKTISDFPYFEAIFNKEGDLHDDEEVKQLLDFLSGGNATDLFAISHGWNNDMQEARGLYERFFASVREEMNNDRPPGLGGRKFAVLGILWPSKKFADEDLIPSGAADFGELGTEEDEIKQELESLKGVFDNPDSNNILDRAKRLVPQLETSGEAAVEFIDLIRSLPAGRERNDEDASDEFFSMPAERLLDALSRPDLPGPSDREEGGAADFDPSASSRDEGGAAGFGLFDDIKSGIRKALNFTTYYQMKERAGTVGSGGVYQVLRRIREANPGLKLHLIGHSFGGRLVTAAANGPEGEPPVKVDSMMLLQAAFSHHGFSERFDGARDGFFRKVISEKRVAGPIVVTHSIKDRAVGIAYPIASRLSGDDAAEFGGPESRYGGIGRNGAQMTPEADNATLDSVTAVYSFQAGKVYNLKADTVIMGHSDIVKGEVAHALLEAVATT